MYEDISLVDSGTLYQGDILVDFPFPILEGSKQIKKNEDTGHFELDNSLPQNDKLAFATESKIQTVMILSQTCDLQRRTNVIVCPVYGLDDFITDNTIKADAARLIRTRRINYWFYLPTYLTLQESIADLQTMIYVPRTVIESYLPKRKTSLSDLGRHHLSWSLASYFGRPAGD